MERQYTSAALVLWPSANKYHSGSAGPTVFSRDLDASRFRILVDGDSLKPATNLLSSMVQKHLAKDRHSSEWGECCRLADAILSKSSHLSAVYEVASSASEYSLRARRASGFLRTLVLMEDLPRILRLVKEVGYNMISTESFRQALLGTASFGFDAFKQILEAVWAAASKSQTASLLSMLQSCIQGNFLSRSRTRPYCRVVTPF